jgi:predicted RNA-binding Zn-ribbon protein involved in translation (DUF1610 family)
MGTLFLLKGTPGPLAPPEVREEPKAREGGPRIRCPRCGWEPGRHDRWMCTCFHVWNTFETGGVCPACGRAWRETQCLRCHEWSLHAEWYAREEGG